MGNTKTVFKYFTIVQQEQEERFLSKMHAKGWKFESVNLIGFYHFSRCNPEEVSYKLDYNQEGLKNKNDYFQMFSDCGWEHITDFVGYSYFRKSGKADEEDIFNDAESKFDLQKRVYTGRVMPLLIIYFCILFPQLLRTSFGVSTTSIKMDNIFANIFTVLSVIYLVMFSLFIFQWHKHEKNVHSDSKSYLAKYVVLYGLIILGFVSTGLIYYHSHKSTYEIKDNVGVYTIDADSLNKSLNKTYELKKGDVIDFNIKMDKGFLHIDISPEDKKSIFFADYKNSSHDNVTIKEDGTYNFKISGRHLKSKIDVKIK